MKKIILGFMSLVAGFGIVLDASAMGKKNPSRPQATHRTVTVSGTLLNRNSIPSYGIQELTLLSNQRQSVVSSRISSRSTARPQDLIDEGMLERATAAIPVGQEVQIVLKCESAQSPTRPGYAALYYYTAPNSLGECDIQSITSRAHSDIRPGTLPPPVVQPVILPR